MALPVSRPKHQLSLSFALSLSLGVLSIPCHALPQAATSGAAQNATAPAASDAPGVPFTADKLASLLPATVYFQGRSAPLQQRNAGGTTFRDGAVVWVSLVDSSGYSSSIQEKYQFYLVTEDPLQFGNASLPAGAYGGGFQGDHFILMDIGGHTIAQGPVETDAELRRPRPLHVVADGPSSLKLYLGRHWVALKQAATPTSNTR